MRGICRLHEGMADLRESHIIPKFVVDWFKESAPTPRLRTVATPNRSEQDGPKLYLFCADCEQRLGRWEKWVAESIFVPLHRDNATTLRYGPELALFCASMALRVGLYFEGREEPHPTELQRRATQRALGVWRDFVLGRRGNPSSFELHLLPVDVLADAHFPDLPPNLNRYLARALDLDLAFGKRSGFTYAKLSRLCVLGVLQSPGRREFHGTRVEVSGGTINPRDCRVPGAFRHFLASKARRVAEAEASTSERQLAKNARLFAADPDAFFRSDLYRAWVADVQMFGEDALPAVEEDRPDAG